MKMNQKTTEMQEDHCLNCGHRTNAATDFLHGTKPKPNDISICLECGHVMAFNDQMRLRSLTEEEIIEIAGHDELVLLQNARGAAKESLKAK